MSRLVDMIRHRELPSWVYYLLVKARYLAGGGVRDDGPVPPRHLSFVFGYDPDFSHVGKTFAGHVVELCQLSPEGRILDIGCGIGRCAMPLTAHLQPPGEYHGVDVRKEGVAWCKKHISSIHPHFHFQHLNIGNPTYSPRGRGHAATFTFPFPDDHFDVIFTKSVFTHMDLDSIARYLMESRRMLKPAGRCLHTFFILNQVSKEYQTTPGSQFHFRYPAKGGMSVSPIEAEKAIAFEEEDLLEIYRQADLEIQDPIRYGWWSGRQDGFSGQDIVIAATR